jgi:excisionase family DNA binding protein
MSDGDQYSDPLDQITSQFVTTRQAADILNVPVNTVARWCRTGLIASRRLGGRYRIPKWVVRNLRHVQTPPLPAAKPFLKLSEAADVLHINVDVLRRWCRTGKIPCCRVGNRYELSQRTIQILLDRLEEGYVDTNPRGRLV